MRSFRFWPDSDIQVEKRKIKANGHHIPLLILKKKNHAGNAPGVLWVHGGGYVTGMKEMVYMGRGESLAKKYDAVVISVGYRLSGLHPFPQGFDDCYAALLYLKEHATELGIRSDQIMVGGESAGGGMCAALCMKARDTGDVNIAYQMPLYPMLDDRDTDSSRDNHAKIWNTRKNHAAWKLYLRKTAKSQTPIYAAPARQTDFSNLPPAYTFVGTAEPFYAETLTFVQRLKNAGVTASVDVYKDMYHAFDMMEPDSAVSQEAIQKFEEHFVYAKEHYFKEQSV